MIEADNLTKFYGSRLAIQGVSFVVQTGEILGFLGPNGAGKTTTMRILAGYLPASGGTARVAGYDVHTHSLAVRQRIGYLPENPPLYPHMSVSEYLHFVAKIKGVERSQLSRRVNFSIERCNLEECQHLQIRKLSKGMKQRVGIAQAIVHDPPVIILDEPTVGLDPKQIIDVRHLIKSLAGEHTLIVSSHILPEVSMTCDRIAIINRGRVIAVNTAAALQQEATGSHGYELEIDGNFEEIQKMLQVVPGVTAVNLLPRENLPEGRSRIQVLVAAGAEPGRHLAAVIIGTGQGLYEMRRTKASLEEVFLELTTQESANINPES